MLYSLLLSLKGIDFFEKSLKEAHCNKSPLCHKGVTLKYWYKHRYPQNLVGPALNKLKRSTSS
jgi:hypothetical protein